MNAKTFRGKVKKNPLKDHDVLSARLQAFDVRQEKYVDS